MDFYFENDESFYDPSLAQKHNTGLRVSFRFHPVLNENLSKQAGRPIHEEIEIVEIKRVGSRGDVAVHRATWADKIRFKNQYEAFMKKGSETVTGTSLEDIPFISSAQRADLIHLGIKTAEQLVEVADIDVGSLGGDGHNLIRKVKSWMEKAKNDSYLLKLEEEKEKHQKTIDELTKKLVSLEAQFSSVLEEKQKRDKSKD